MVEKNPAKNKAAGQGRAVTLPNGDRRIDYIRDQYYKKGKTRSDIKNAINDMLTKAKRDGEVIPYQIVFAATKTKEDPRIEASKKAAAKAAAAKKD